MKTFTVVYVPDKGKPTVMLFRNKGKAIVYLQDVCNLYCVRTFIGLPVEVQECKQPYSEYVACVAGYEFGQSAAFATGWVLEKGVIE